jgi:hypothetical protein
VSDLAVPAALFVNAASIKFCEARIGVICAATLTLKGGEPQCHCLILMIFVVLTFYGICNMGIV